MQRVIAVLLGFVIAFSCLNCMGQEVMGQQVHILVRPKDGQAWFHLGEPITLEAACVDSATGHYLLPCGVVLKAESVSIGGRLSADRIDQRTWLDAQAGRFPLDLSADVETSTINCHQKSRKSRPGKK